MAHSADELIPTRATLIQRLKNWQDQSSWQVFFDTYWSLIYGVAMQGGLSRAEAEDVVQETLISVAKHMPTFKYDPSIGSFKGWLLNMTRWRIADQLRKRKNMPVSSQEAEMKDIKIDSSVEISASELEKFWNSEWERNLLNTAVANARRQLDPEQYQIFDFYVNKAWAPEKVAKRFCVPIGQVYLAKHRVGDSIRQEMDRLRNDMI